MTTASFATAIAVFYNHYNYLKVIELLIRILTYYYLLTHTTLFISTITDCPALLLLRDHNENKAFCLLCVITAISSFVSQTGSYSFLFPIKICRSCVTIFTNLSILVMCFFEFFTVYSH